MLRFALPVGVAALLLAALLGHTPAALAQIAPTNSATISGTVSDSNGKPVANAIVSLTGPKNISKRTDSRGQFAFIGLPFGTYQISAIASGLGTASSGDVPVQGDINVAIRYQSLSQNGLKTIASVSSRANANFNISPASVTQVSPLANAFEGKTSWRTIMEQIPGVARAGVGNGATNYAATADSPISPMQIAINGALPYETAVLVDDMPLIGAGNTSTAGTGTNLALYPLNGFSSADVVRGPGAGAPSIVDSIGGSFVLHAPSPVSRNHYDFSVSSDPYGGFVTNALAAVHLNRLSTVVTYGVNDSPGPLSTSGVPEQTAFEPLTVDGRAFSCSAACALTNNFNPNYVGGFVGVTQGLLQCCFAQTAAWSQHSGSVAAIYSILPSINAEVFFAGESSQMPNLLTAMYTVNFQPPAGYAGSILPGTHLFSEAGLYDASPVNQTSSLVEEKLTAAFYRGTLKLAALQNRTWSSSSNDTVGSQAVRLFGGGSVCSDTSAACKTGTFVPTVFNGETHTITQTPSALNNPISSVNRDLLVSYVTQVGESFHVGGSFVKSSYVNDSIVSTFAGPPISSSSQRIVYSPNNSETTNELRLFFGGSVSDKLSFDLALYSVDANYHVPNPAITGLFTDRSYPYSAPRLGIVWRPSPWIAIRGSAGGGFAEPPLNNLIGTNGTPQPNSRTAPTFYTVTLTNLGLRPETSFGFDIGGDVRLRNGTIISLDAYRSNLYGQMYRSSSLNGTYTGTVGTLPLYASQFGNLGVSRYEGVLLDAHYDPSHGTFWSLAGGLTRGYVVSVPTGFYNAAGSTCNLATGVGCSNLTVVPNVNFNGTFAASIPYAQGLATVGYRWEPEKYIDLVGTYYGNNNTYFRPAFLELDGNAAYPINRQLSLLLTYRNITGVYDGPLLTIAPSVLTGASTITGPPSALFGEMYGPRTLILTARIHM